MSFVINNFFCDFFLCFVSIYMYIYKYTLSVGQYHVKQNSVRMPVVGAKWQDLLTLGRGKGLDSCLGISRRSWKIGINQDVTNPIKQINILDATLSNVQ